MLNVVCIKRGVAYSPEYVNNLYSMVERHLTLPHKFICLTENKNGLSSEIKIHDFVEKRLEKWWNKLELFKPHPVLVGNRTLFLDLDTVIVGNIDEIASYDGNFAILRDMFLREKRKPVEPGRGAWLGSAIMSISPGFGEFIWKDLQENISQVRNYPGDQQFIAKKVIENNIIPDIWQEMYPNQIHSYKASKLEKHFKHFYDQGLRIVCFHGKPRPHEVKHLPWMKEHWK